MNKDLYYANFRTSYYSRLTTLLRFCLGRDDIQLVASCKDPNLFLFRVSAINWDAFLPVHLTAAPNGFVLDAIIHNMDRLEALQEVLSKGYQPVTCRPDIVFLEEHSSEL